MRAGASCWPRGAVPWPCRSESPLAEAADPRVIVTPLRGRRDDTFRYAGATAGLP